LLPLLFEATDERRKTNYDLLYKPRLTVTGYEDISPLGSRLGAGPGGLDCYLDVPYGSDATETLDLFRADGPEPRSP